MNPLAAFTLLSIVPPAVVALASKLGPWVVGVAVGLLLLVWLTVLVLRFFRALGSMNPQIGRIVSELRKP